MDCSNHQHSTRCNSAYWRYRGALLHPLGRRQARLDCRIHYTVRSERHGAHHFKKSGDLCGDCSICRCACGIRLRKPRKQFVKPLRSRKHQYKYTRGTNDASHIFFQPGFIHPACADSESNTRLNLPRLVSIVLRLTGCQHVSGLAKQCLGLRSRSSEWLSHDSR